KVLTPADPDRIAPVGATTTLAPGEFGSTAGSTSTTTTTTTLPPQQVRPLDPFDPTMTTVGTTTTTTTTTTAPGQSSSAGAGGAVTTAATTTTTTIVPLEIVRETGTLAGQGADRPLLLRFIDDSATQGRVRVGSPVQTAGGLLSIAPPGIPIGQVTSVEDQVGTRALRVEVSLSAGDLTKLNFVQVLRYRPTTSGG
ncbi:MAG: putative rod shape-determining protein MreC, partial [Actinomycetota bacterium]